MRKISCFNVLELHHMSIVNDILSLIILISIKHATSACYFIKQKMQMYFVSKSIG